MKAAIVSTDLHLTSKKDDQYRWDFINSIPSLLHKHKAEYFFILGDLTDEKDKHNSFLVNKLSNIICKISEIAEVHILKGNHDYIDPDYPFFEFLDNFDNVFYYKSPELTGVSDKGILMLPHTRDPEKDWAMVDFNSGDFIFMHQTINGVIGSNGKELYDTLKIGYFGGVTASIYSGDIHVPQIIGNVNYIGTPYPINQNDSFTPRYLVIDFKKDKRIFIVNKNTIRKITIDYLGKHYFYDEYIKKGDKVKVRIKVKTSTSPNEIDKIKEIVRKRLLEIGAELTGFVLEKSTRVKLIDPNSRTIITDNDSIFNAFCKKEKIIDSYLMDIGRRFLK
jgi:hypothetical protein